MQEDNDEKLLRTLLPELFVVVVVIGVSSLRPRPSPTCPDLISVTHVVRGRAPGCLFARINDLRGPLGATRLQIPAS